MNRTKLLLTALAVAALAIPTSAATWYGVGSYEPSTQLDETGGRMFKDAPDKPYASDPRKAPVYFNVYQGFSSTAATPNVGATESRVWAAPDMSWHALLGIWRDCNKDGYVGLAEGAVREYRVDLGLHDPAVCPVQAWSYPDLPVHNDGQWIYEYLAIGNVDPCQFRDALTRQEKCDSIGGFSRNPVVIYSNDTFIWGDPGRPGPVPVSTGSCPISPPPYGTTSGTGYAIYYVDCLASITVRATVSGAWNDALGVADPDDNLGLRFEDPRRPYESSSPLNQHLPANLYGNPQQGKPGQTGVLERNSGDAQFDVFDCDADTKKSVAEEPTKRHAKPYVRQPSDPTSQPTGSLWDGAEDLAEDTRHDCNPETGRNDLGEWYFLAMREDSTGGSADVASNRSKNLELFEFFNGARGTGSPIVDRTVGAYRTPADGGLGVTRGNLAGPDWSGRTGWTTTPQLMRTDLQPSGRAYYTWYARLNDSDVATLGWSLPTATPGKYGSEACATIGPGAPAQNGWECDPDKWWTRSDGVDTMPYSSMCATTFEKENNPTDPTRRDRCEEMGGVRWGAVVGDPYHLRDVDCFDGHVADETVYASLIPTMGLPTCE